MIHCVLHDPNDSVAVVVTEGIKAGQQLTALILDEDRTITVPCKADIPLGHKVAMKDMAIGATVTGSLTLRGAFHAYDLTYAATEPGVISLAAAGGEHDDLVVLVYRKERNRWQPPVLNDDCSEDTTGAEIKTLIARGTLPGLRYLRHGVRSGQRRAKSPSREG